MRIRVLSKWERRLAAKVFPPESADAAIRDFALAKIRETLDKVRHPVIRR